MPRRTRSSHGAAARGAPWLGIGAILAIPALARSRYLRWGATASEVATALPGDDLVPRPNLVATRAVTIRAGADRVWPWLAQLGQGRGGFYSYDFLENLAGCRIHSADRIVPEWQHIEVGDEVRLHPRLPLSVALVSPGRSLVLRGAQPPGAGAEAGAGTAAVEGPAAGTVAGAPPYDFTWAFVLNDRSDGATRLVVRERYGYTRRWTPLLTEPVELISFVMTRRMLAGIRDRAERG